MIYKSYIFEKNLNTLKEKLVLFYGENLGLKNYFKKTVKKLNQKKEIINFIQDDLEKKSDDLLDQAERMVYKLELLHYKIKRVLNK